jgi:Putative adhesin
MTFTSATGRSPVPPGPPVGAPGSSGALRMTPGRWIALAVAVPVALALIGWAGFSTVTSFARGSYSFGYPVTVQDHVLTLNMNSGNITLRQGSDDGNAWLTGVVQYGLVRPGISEANTPTGTDFGVDCAGITAGNCGVNATLDVPARTGVTLRSNGGDIAASGFSSGVSLWASGGNVSASNLSGDLNVDTGGGDLTGTGLTGQIQITAEGGDVYASNLKSPDVIQINTGGGDLTANGVNGNVNVSAAGGDIYGNGVASSQAYIQSGGGDVTLTFITPPQNLQINAAGGDVYLTLPPGGTKYDISTNTGGGNLDDNLPNLFSSTAKHKITVDSGGGDITISQS